MDHSHHNHDHSHSDAGSVDGGEQTICPVMNIPVNKEVAGARGLVREYKGQKYYFCCNVCAPQFDENPKRYVEFSS